MKKHNLKKIYFYMFLLDTYTVYYILYSISSTVHYTTGQLLLLFRSYIKKIHLKCPQRTFPFY